jgi:iron-sulfur cluster repair protein YtfE (RIC family)
MEAIALLEKHHEEMMQLLTALEKSEPGRERKSTFQKMQRSLLAHMFIEEETFYPMVVRRLSHGDPIAEGYEEHSGARVSLARCALALKADELFQMRIGVLKELISHHVKEERETIFPQAKKALDKAAREALGVQLEEHFNKALRSTAIGPALNRKTTARELRALDT